MPAVGMEISVPLFFSKIKIIAAAMVMLIGGKVAVMAAVGQAFGLSLVQSLRRCGNRGEEGGGADGRGRQWRQSTVWRAAVGAPSSSCRLLHCWPLPAAHPDGTLSSPPLPPAPSLPVACCCPPEASLRLCCLARQ